MGATKRRTRSKTKPSRGELPSSVRVERIRKGLTQEELASRAGMHRNSIKNIENGTTREVFVENATALADALDSTVEKLGLRIRRSNVAPSIRLRSLSPEQRELIREILALPESQYSVLRAALDSLRSRKGRKS